MWARLSQLSIYVLHKIILSDSQYQKGNRQWAHKWTAEANWTADIKSTTEPSIKHFFLFQARSTLNYYSSFQATCPCSTNTSIYAACPFQQLAGLHNIAHEKTQLTLGSPCSLQHVPFGPFILLKKMQKFQAP